MKIRKYFKGEEEILYEIFKTSIQINAKNYYSTKQLLAWSSSKLNTNKWREKIKNINPYVVVNKSEIIGYADLQSNGYIDHFFIKGGYAKKGVGKYLMNYLINEAKNRQINILTSDVSLAAQEFFKKFDFYIVQRKKVDINGVLLENALMKLEISTKNNL